MIKYKNQAFTPYSSDLIEGFIATPITEQEPFFKWKGGKIPMSLWHEVNAFFEWAYKEFQSESIVQLFYNASTKEWKAWAMLQFVGTGMTVSQSKEQSHWDKFDKDQRHFLNGFDAFGSIHNHCKSGAFQSSTDADDERGKNGIHITVGNLTSPQYSTHFRVSFKREFYEPVLAEWFDCEYEFSDNIKGLIIEERLTVPVESSFPEEWKENCYKKEPIKTFNPQPFVSNWKTEKKPLFDDADMEDLSKLFEEVSDFLRRLVFEKEETEQEAQDLIREMEWWYAMVQEDDQKKSVFLTDDVLWD